ncbi:MAG: sensor domain-containing diguanylate cyclase [Sedimenticola sp.]
MQPLRIASYLLLFLVVNAFIWWGVNSHHESLKQSELDSFSALELTHVRDIARATEAWITHRPGGRSFEEALQEAMKLIITPLKLEQRGNTWIYLNGRSIQDTRPDFPESYRGKNIKQIFDLQRRAGADHYDSLVKGVLQGNEDSDWFVWSQNGGRELAAWTSIKIDQQILTIGTSSPEAAILSATGLEQELERDVILGVLQSGLTLVLVMILFYAHQTSLRHIRELQGEIGDRALVETALRESEERYRRLFSENKAVQLIFDSATGDILDANEAAIDYYGYPLEQIRTMSFDKLNADSKAMVHNEVISAKEEERPYYLFRHRLVTGEARDVEMYTTPLRIKGNNVLYAIIHDITERRQMEEEIKRLGNFDVLTGLPNRAMLFDRMHMSIEQAKRHHQHLAVLFFDLDGFKAVNDTHGHIAGDRLLREAGRRLLNCIRKSDTAARFGGDEFVVLLTDVNEDDAVVSAIEKIQETLRQPFELEHARAHIGSSVGVSFFPHNGETADQLLHAADSAMYKVKQEGKNGYRFA